MQAKGGGQEWFYHAPLSKAKREKQSVPAASQIPGLSAEDLEAMERETGTNKRNWIRETDSKYIQLAKLGGRKNLLTFNAMKKQDSPKTYPRVDWFDHVPMTTEDEKKILAEKSWFPPEYMVHEPYTEPLNEPSHQIHVDLGLARKERKEIQDKYKSREIPFHSDDKSVWKRQYDVIHEKRASPKGLVLPEIAKPESCKKEVQFSKLLGGGYGDEWFESRSRQQKKNRKKWENKNGGISSGLYNLTEYQESISKREVPPPKLKPITFTQRLSKEKEIAKEPFKLSKFSKVKSKLSTRAITS